MNSKTKNKTVEEALKRNHPLTYYRFPDNFRGTFGITYPNSRLIYEDIRKAFLEARYIKQTDLDRGFLYASPTKKNYENLYLIHVDAATKKQIETNKEAPCVVSFQTRDNGRFAMVRLFKNEGE